MIDSQVGVSYGVYVKYHGSDEWSARFGWFPDDDNGESGKDRAESSARRCVENGDYAEACVARRVTDIEFL